MKLILTIIISLTLFNLNQIFSQTEQVRQGLKKIAEGRIDDVKRDLPDLIAEYPDDPGVQLLHGAVIEDGYKAVEKYLSIITNYPKSEWADDAYWRIVQFYAIIGDTAKAKIELTNYRKKYPASEFLIPSADAVKTSVFQKRKGSMEASFKDIDLSDKSLKKQNNEDESDDDSENTSKTDSKSDNKKVIPAEKPIEEKHKFGLQVGIFATIDAAKSEVDRFKGLRMLAEIKQKKLGNETMHAVVIGDYSSKTSAENAKFIVQQQCKCIPIIFEK